jgi:hypothetical protein
VALGSSLRTKPEEQARHFYSLVPSSDKAGVDIQAFDHVIISPNNMQGPEDKLKEHRGRVAGYLEGQLSCRNDQSIIIFS